LKRGKAKGFATRYFGGAEFSKEFCTTQLEIFKSSIGDICKKSEHGCYVVNYEDFLHNPKSEIEKIFKHIGFCEINVSYKDGRLEVGGRFMDVLPGYWGKA